MNLLVKENNQLLCITRFLTGKKTSNSVQELRVLRVIESYLVLLVEVFIILVPPIPIPSAEDIKDLKILFIHSFIY